MNDRAIEELCKWHDEQVARLESQDPTPRAAPPNEKQAKTSVAQLEAKAEITRQRTDSPPGGSGFDAGTSTKSDRSISQIPAPIFWALALGQVVFLVWLVFETMGWL
ncbi:MAG: hypothetical protein ACXU8R_03790 [Xanthobacteraceae bacterium]